MTIQQLEYALMLQRMGSFTRSSQALNITQPALSLQVQKLEEEIGLTLFDRSSAPVVATEDGKRFLERAQEIVTSSRNLMAFSNELQEDYTGTLKIGMIPTLSPFLAPLFSKPLSRDFPMLQVEITEMLTEYVLQQLKAGDIDVGIISTPIRRPGISVTPLFYERFYLYSSDLHNSDTEFLVENIDYQALWLLEEGNCFRDQINDFCSIRNQPEKKQMTYRCNSIDSLIRMVDQYGGTTILPELTTISLSEEQSQHVVSIAGKAREIGLVARNAVNKERYIKLLEKYILENIPRKLKDPNGLEIVDPGISLD